MAKARRRHLWALLAATACAAPPAAPAAPPWCELFDGSSLAGFTITDFGGQGEVAVHDGVLRLGIGSPLTGVTWNGPFAAPDQDYELEVVAERRVGNDFFVGLTFPVGADHLTLVLGGWGGAVCGLSSLDGDDAAHNETRSLHSFVLGRRYTARVTVTAAAVRVTLDGEPLCAVARGQHRLGLRPEVLLSRPLGLCTFATAAAVRTLRWRPLAAAKG